MRRRDGFTVVDALVAAGLAGIALAGLAAVAGLTSRTLRLARDASTAVALATERLELVRAGGVPAATDHPTGSAGTAFTRTWEETGGRGLPRRLTVRVAWETHAIELGTAVPP